MKIKIFLIIGLLFIITKVIHSQTPGLIFEPAGSVSGREVLDPNGDGYVSSDNSGFTFHDRTESEIPFIPLIFPGTEPNSDLESGPSCGFTDFVESLENDPAQNYLDNNGNWIFRLRMANVATNAKSYSILIDANELFGPNDPNYTANNPGFELEIVLATKFGVFVYDHRATNPNPCIPVISYLGTSNYQKAIAFSTICGSTNYFLDFFVKMEDITLKFNYDETTNFRIAISSNAAANKSSICSLTSISDLGGVTDQCGSLESCFTNIVENQVPCPPEDVNSGNCQAISATPVITSPIGNESVSVSGTSSDADSTIIEIYIDGILVGSAYVIDGFWEILGLSPLISDQIITARAKASTKAYSDFSEPVIVGSTCSVEVSSASYCGKGIQGTSNLIGAIIRVYQGNSTTPMVPSAGTQWNTGSFITVNSSGAFIWKKNSETGEKTVCNSGGGNQITNGAYRITQQESSKCESDGIWICVGTPGTTATPSITTSPITSSTESISGTISNPDNLSGVTIFVYINGSQEYTTTTTSGGAWTLPDISLSECDVITVRALNTSKCISDLSSEYSVQGPQTSPPVITGEYCTSTNITTVTGTSAEADGTLIQIYNNVLAEGLPAVVNKGRWTAELLSIAAGNTITAIATAPCKTASEVSDGVIVSSQNTNTPEITTVVVTEGDTEVSGKGANGNIISLYIDDYPVYSDLEETTLATATVSGGLWTINTIHPQSLYAGGELTAKASNISGCPGNASNIKIVQCIAPSNNKAIEAIEADYCQTIENGHIKITNSEPSVIYTPVLTDAGNTVFGYSGLGNGGDLILKTYGIDAVPLEVTVSAERIGGLACKTVNSISDSFNTIYLLPQEKNNFANKTAICDRESVDITIEATEPSVIYSLYEHGTNNALGGPVIGNGNNIVINTGELSYELIIEITAGIYYEIPDKTCEIKFSNTIPIVSDPGCGAILPVELLYFDARCGTSAEVIINWATASEKNNDFFSIYRSTDAINWEKIKEIQGVGNSNIVNEYVFKDIEPETHDTYYKLSQTDFDGTTKEYSIVVVYCKFNHKKIELFPVPTSEVLNLSFYNEHHIVDQLIINIFDSAGRFIKQEIFTSSSDQNQYSINVSDLKSGNYFIHVLLGESYFYTHPFIISK